MTASHVLRGPSLPASNADTCYHCGLPVREPGRYTLRLGDRLEALCCAGCEAVAGAIVAGGLQAFYAQRTRPSSAAAPARVDLTIYDQPAIQASFVRIVGDDEREAALVIEDLSCPACAWLNETYLRALEGVTAVEVSYATRRVRVRWKPSTIALSQVFAAVAAIGYRVRPYTSTGAEALRRASERRLLWQLFVAGFAMMQVMMFAVPLYLADAEDMTPDIERLLRLASFALTVPVMLWSAQPFLQGAWRDLRRGRLGMDVPVAVGIVIGFAASTWATFAGNGEIWFDSVAMFVAFLLAARYIELRLRHRAARAIEDLARLQPATGWRIEGDRDDAVPVEVAAQSLVAGDRVLVRSGAAAPGDGIVVRGSAAFNEAALTGESVPVHKDAGDRVLAGTVNTGAPIVLRLDQVGPQTWLAGIERMVERAGSARPRITLLADRYAGAFVLVIMTLALATAFAWWPTDPSMAMRASLAVLIVTCPCALSLATPAVLTAATARLASNGVLVTTPDALERLARVDHIAFDKTGSLSTGVFALVAIDHCDRITPERALAIAASLEVSASHPVAAAFRTAAVARRIAPVAATAVREVVGQGIEGVVDGTPVRLGRAPFALRGRTDPRTALDASGLWLADEDGLIARFVVEDALREDAAAATAELRALGVQLSMLSGDTASTVARTAAALGIDDYACALTPAAKQASVRRWQDTGAIVAMVGDGINDAPVLAAADVGIAVAGATPMAQLAADIVLVRNQLGAVTQALRTARRARTIVRQNLGWAFAYNIAAVPLAALGWVAPWVAGLGMALSSIVVVLNATRAAR